MFSFINFATVIVFLVTMFDDSTQLVTVPRSSPDPIAELCRALVVLKRERFHIREVFKLSSDGHTEKVYWYGRSQYIEALNAPHHINENVSCYTDYASGMRQRTPCKLDYDTHRVFDIVAPCNDEEDDVVVKRSILLPPENDSTVREVRIFDLDERDECGELPDPKTIEGLYRGYKDRDMYWTCADEKVIEPADAVHYVRQRALAQYLTDSGHAGLLMEDDFEPLEEPLKRTTDWLASKDESRFEELYTAYAPRSTRPHFYIRNSMTISKNSSTMSRTGSRTNMAGAISDSRRKPMMEELSNATRCPNEAERKKIS